MNDVVSQCLERNRSAAQIRFRPFVEYNVIDGQSGTSTTTYPSLSECDPVVGNDGRRAIVVNSRVGVTQNEARLPSTSSSISSSTNVSNESLEIRDYHQQIRQRYAESGRSAEPSSPLPWSSEYVPATSGANYELESLLQRVKALNTNSYATSSEPVSGLSSFAAARDGDCFADSFRPERPWFDGGSFAPSVPASAVPMARHPLPAVNQLPMRANDGEVYPYGAFGYPMPVNDYVPAMLPENTNYQSEASWQQYRRAVAQTAAKTQPSFNAYSQYYDEGLLTSNTLRNTASFGLEFADPRYHGNAYAPAEPWHRHEADNSLHWLGRADSGLDAAFSRPCYIPAAANANFSAMSPHFVPQYAAYSELDASRRALQNDGYVRQNYGFGNGFAFAETQHSDAYLQSGFNLTPNFPSQGYLDSTFVVSGALQVGTEASDSVFSQTASSSATLEPCPQSPNDTALPTVSHTLQSGSKNERRQKWRSQTSLDNPPSQREISQQTDAHEEFCESQPACDGVPPNPFLNAQIPEWLAVYSLAPVEFDVELSEAWSLFDSDELDRFDKLLLRLFHSDLQNIVEKYERTRQVLSEFIESKRCEEHDSSRQSSRKSSLNVSMMQNVELRL